MKMDVHPFLAYLLTPSYLPTVPTYISMAHHTHLQAPHVVYPKKKNMASNDLVPIHPPSKRPHADSSQPPHT